MLEGRRLSCGSVARRPREITTGDTSNMRHVKKSCTTNATCIQHCSAFSLFFVSLFHFSWIYVNLCESVSTDTCRMPSTSLLCARSSKCTFSRWMVHSTVHRCAPVHRPSLTWSVVSSCVSSFANVECASSAWRRCSWGKTWRDAEGLSGTAETIVDWTLTARPFAVLISFIIYVTMYNKLLCDKLESLDRKESFYDA